MQIFSKAVILLSLAATVAACGVRGDPIPPKHPEKLGRGHPTYPDVKDALTYPELPSVAPGGTEENEDADGQRTEKTVEKTTGKTTDKKSPNGTH